MPIAGKGMLLTSMDIDPSDEAEFNRWYDREHLEERVAIDGFLEARRYVAHEGSPKYLCLYSTGRFEVLDSPAYRAVLANPTVWSKTRHGAFQEHDPRDRAHHDQPRTRAAVRRSASSAFAPRPPGEDKLRGALQDMLDPRPLDGIISMHLIESDPVLSRPITDNPAGFRSGCRRLVCADRWDQCECGRCGPRGALCEQCGIQIRRRGLDRRLQADVGPRKERHPAVITAPRALCCSAAFNRFDIKTARPDQQRMVNSQKCLCASCRMSLIR